MPRLALVMGLIFALVLGLLPVRQALAHAELARSEPAVNTSVMEPPPQVQLWFTEEVDPSFTEARVLDRSGRRVDAGNSRVLPDDRLSLVLGLPQLPRGTYTVTWTALSSVDGHVTRGSFAFAVGEAVASETLAAATLGQANEVPPNPAGVAARWLGVVGALLTAGGFFFLAGVLLPVERRLTTGRDGQSLAADAYPRLRGLMGIGLAGLLLGSAGLVLVQSGELSDGSPSGMRAALAQLVFGTRLGVVMLVRLAILAALAFLIVQTIRPAAGNQRATWAGAGLSALLLLTFSLIGHGGATGARPWVNVVVDWGHLLAASVWVGGVAHLAALLPAVLRLGDRPRRAAFAALLPRFSTLALAGGGLLVATGLYGAVLHVPDLQALGDTLYGNGVLVKVLALALLVTLGAVNLVFLTPRLLAEGRAAVERAPRAGRWFRGMVLAEVGVGVLALCATALVISVSPARQTVTLPGTRPFATQQQADDLQVRLQIAPLETGFNSFRVALRDRQDQPVDADRVTLRTTMPTHPEMGEQEIVTAKQEPGAFFALGSYLSMVGPWHLDVLVRRSGLDDARTTFVVEVPAVSPGKQAAQTSPTGGVVAGAPIVALELVGLGLLLALISWRRGGAASRTGTVTLGVAAAAFLMAGFVGAAAQLPASDVTAAAVQNPFPPDERSLSIGQQVYQQNCLVCHGPRGRGDGPAGVTLRPRPADFEVHLKAGHTDADLYNFLTNGVPATAMPSFRERLTEEERWHVLNYIKSLVNAPDR